MHRDARLPTYHSPGASKRVRRQGLETGAKADAPGVPEHPAAGTVVLGRGDAPANYVAVADVAHVAARVLREPKRWLAGSPSALQPSEAAR